MRKLFLILMLLGVAAFGVYSYSDRLFSLERGIQTGTVTVDLVSYDQTDPKDKYILTLADRD